MCTPQPRRVDRSDELTAMTVTGLIGEAGVAGLTIRAEQGKLLVRGPQHADLALVEEILRRKADLMPMLLGMDLDDVELFEERAAIAQYDGGLTRAEAERLAWAEVRTRCASSYDARAAHGARS